MKTICSNVVSELIIKNSRFITLLIKLGDSNIDKYLDEVRINYPKASHYTYAYIYNDIKHSSDDGEPGGTAGMPILNVLEKESLNNILCIVVRYFGGIKLGAGGLIRAYTKSVTECLKKTSCLELIDGYLINISFDYSSEKNINYILDKSIILSKNYDEKVLYECLVDEDTYLKLNSYNPTIIKKCLIEKDFK